MKLATLALLTSMATATTTRADDKPAENPHERVREQQRFLSKLWVFASLNYLYCDVIGLMDANMLRQYQTGEVEGFRITENFLLGGAIFMQLPLSMVVLSTVLPPRASRIANITAGAIMTAVQTATLFAGTPTKYYAFSSGVEIATTAFITAYAALSMTVPPVTPIVAAQPEGGVTLGAAVRF